MTKTYGPHSCWVTSQRSVRGSATWRYAARRGAAAATHLHVREAHPHQEVGRPVAAAGHRHGGGPRALAEQLGHQEPGDGPGPHLEERHEAEHGRHADVGHPAEPVLRRRSVTRARRRGRSQALTSSAMATVRKAADTAMPIRPASCSGRRPARSTTNSCGGRSVSATRSGALQVGGHSPTPR
ncbi:hypothetical protein EYF80_060735 [Liparis tanakae]|uniref:Uncharacterized protein n=1 Tax=Liparis tanakae TaxID=230148 RepID=A0A4Z2EJJ9_9TELE|nr:hypothetical protein EYF80_060735 [Liparis tanakae]